MEKVREYIKKKHHLDGRQTEGRTDGLAGGERERRRGGGREEEESSLTACDIALWIKQDTPARNPNSQIRPVFLPVSFHYPSFRSHRLASSPMGRFYLFRDGTRFLILNLSTGRFPTFCFLLYY